MIATIVITSASPPLRRARHRDDETRSSSGTSSTTRVAGVIDHARRSRSQHMTATGLSASFTKRARCQVAAGNGLHASPGERRCVFASNGARARHRCDPSIGAATPLRWRWLWRPSASADRPAVQPHRMRVRRDAHRLPGAPDRGRAAGQRARPRPLRPETSEQPGRSLDDARILVRRHINPAAPARLPDHATETRKKPGHALSGMLEICAFHREERVPRWLRRDARLR